MEPPARPATQPAGVGPLAPGQRWRSSIPPLTWPRALVMVALFAGLLLANQACQKQQIRVTKQQAVAKALPYAGFVPQRTQVRFIRQGINSRPFYAVSFSIPEKKGNGYLRVTTVRIDANTAKVAAVNR